MRTLFILSLVFAIQANPVRSVRQFPYSMKCEPRNLLRFFKHDLVRGITRAVIIFMHTGEIKNGRDALFRKIVMIGTVVKAIRIIFGIIGVIQIQLCVGAVDRFIDLVEVEAEAV